MTYEASGICPTVLRPSGEQAADPERVIAHGQRSRGKWMDAHRQGPLLRLVSLEGEGRSVGDLEEEALSTVLRAAEEGLSSLSGSGSSRLRFLRSVQSGAEGLLAESPASQFLPG